MLVAASGRGTGGNTSRAVAEALVGAGRRLSGRAASYGFLFVGPEHDLAMALGDARRAHPSADFIGCTTAGEITEAGLTHGGVAALLVSNDRGKHAVRFSRHADSPSRAAEEIGSPFQAIGDRTGVGTTVLLTDGLAGTGEALVDELRGRRGAGLHEIVGGAAGDEGKFAGTRVGGNTDASVSAVVALHVLGESRWGVGVDHGLSPATPPMLVTRASGTTVYEIDDRPAFEVYKDYAKTKGVILDEKNAPPFFINNELGVLLFDQLKKARAPLAANEDGSLTCAAPVPSGASVCMLDGSRDDLVAAAKRAATEARERLAGRRAAGILLFDCICRGAILGSDFHREIRAVRDVFPDVPLAGFLTYGEIARYSGRLDGWHNTTAVVVAIPEA
jgi:hypothetical protein